MPNPLTITVRTSRTISDHECQVMYLDEAGRYVMGTVACSAEDLLVAVGGVLDANAEVR